MHATRTTALVAGAGSMITGSLLLGAAPASANICTAEVLSLTSRDLQDGDGQDEIRFELGDDTYGTFTYPNNWERNASLGSPRENFTSTVRFELWDRDYPATTTIDTTYLFCNSGYGTVELEGNGGLYVLEYNVTP